MQDWPVFVSLEKGRKVVFIVVLGILKILKVIIKDSLKCTFLYIFSCDFWSLYYFEQRWVEEQKYSQVRLLLFQKNMTRVGVKQ